MAPTPRLARWRSSPQVGGYDATGSFLAGCFPVARSAGDFTVTQAEGNELANLFTAMYGCDTRLVLLKPPPLADGPFGGKVYQTADMF